MKATIDKTGRLTIPKTLRERVGLYPGVVEVYYDGAGLRIEPAGRDSLLECNGQLLVAATGMSLDDDAVRKLRDADQR